MQAFRSRPAFMRKLRNGGSHRSSKKVQRNEGISASLTIHTRLITPKKMTQIAQNIEKAVNYWIDLITSEELNSDNGEDSHFGLLNVVSQMGRKKITPEQIEKFREKATEVFTREFEKRNGRYSVGVDYNPDIPFQEVFDYSGISAMAAPCKTYVNIYADKVVAKNGYGAPWIEL